MQDPDVNATALDSLNPTTPAVRRRRRGPNTPAGKRRIALNAVKHGLSARSLIVPGLERVSDLETHYERFRNAWKPTDAVEERLVDHMAELTWRQRRVVRFETALFDVDGTDGVAGARPADRWWLAINGGIDQLIRHEAHLLRAFYRASAELRAYREQRAAAVVVEMPPTPDIEEREP